jgi:hypothetical protein
VCAKASVSGRRLSTSRDHSIFPIARSHPVLRIHRRCRTKRETEYRRYKCCFE